MARQRTGEAPTQAEGDGAPAGGARLTTAARLGLVAVCLAVFLSALDQYVVVAPRTLEAISRNVGVSYPLELDRAFWIVNAYILGYIVAMPLIGRVSDVYGRRRVFAACLALFALGSLFCGLAPALGAKFAPDYTTPDGAALTPLYAATRWLLDQLGRLGLDTSRPALDVLTAARFAQAIGGGALVPIGIAVAGDLFGGGRRSLALGLVGAVAEAGGVLGPLWGAWINGRWGWQWIFFLNVPLAALLLVAGYRALPRGRGARGRIDYLGALLFGGFLVCLALGFGLPNGALGLLQRGSAVEINVRLLIAAGVLLALFLGLELARRSPAIDVRLFRRGAFLAAALLSFLTGAALVVAIALVPNFIENLQPSPDGFAGILALLRMTALIPFGALAGGWIASRFGCPPAAALGATLTAVGLFLMSRWPGNVGLLQITIATTLAGLGFGLVIAPTSTSALNAAGAGRAGMAASVVTVLRMTGMLLGLSWLTLWAVSRFDGLLAAAHDPTDVTAVPFILHQVFGEVFLIAAVIAAAGVVPALLLWRRPRAGASPDVELADPAYAGFVAPPVRGRRRGAGVPANGDVAD